MFSSFTYVMLIITCEVYAVTSLGYAAGKCELVPKSDTIALINTSMGPYGMCTNLGKIDGFKECRGSCESSDTYNKEREEYERTCQSCRLARYSMVPVLLTCEYGMKKEYAVATAAQCSCKRCEDVTYPEKPSYTMNSTNTGF